VVYVNVIGQSGLPFGDTHTVLGVLPVLVHVSPRRVLIVGLGSGDTAYAALARPETERVACVEIVGSLAGALRALDARAGAPGLGALLRDPRLDLRVGDGRALLAGGAQRYDVIEADALRPTSSHSGALYSREYFTLVRERLRPGGLAVTWAPTSRIRDTFAAVFPHTLLVDEVLLGAASPIAWDPMVLRERARLPAVRAHFEAAGVDLEALLGPYLAMAPRPVEPPAPGADLNTDLFPRDEYQVPRP
jgi:hypothetical protein